MSAKGLMIACMGPADVYADAHQLDYDAFMRSTESARDREPIAEQRAAVSKAFSEMCGAYFVVGLIAEPGFTEASNRFCKVLDRAVGVCRAAGVDAQTNTSHYFTVEYTRHADFASVPPRRPPKPHEMRIRRGDIASRPPKAGTKWYR